MLISLQSSFYEYFLMLKESICSLMEEYDAHQSEMSPADIATAAIQQTNLDRKVVLFMLSFADAGGILYVQDMCEKTGNLKNKLHDHWKNLDSLSICQSKTLFFK